MTELFRTAREANVQVEYCRLPLNKSMSAAVDGDDYILMDYSLLWADAEEKEHLAHELGHCLTGSFCNPYAAHDIRQKHENRADKWAIKKLLPFDEMKAAMQKGYTKPWELAEYFGVTEVFMRKALCLYAKGNLAVEYYSL